MFILSAFCLMFDDVCMIFSRCFLVSRCFVGPNLLEINLVDFAFFGKSVKRPRSVSCETKLLDTQGFFGVRDTWVRPLEISWIIRDAVDSNPSLINLPNDAFTPKS